MRPFWSGRAEHAAFAAAPICSHHRGPQLVVMRSEAIEETKESGIILASTGREQRLNNSAATLRSKIT
jgi:hypothetical protein